MILSQEVYYIENGKISEGQVQLVAIAPLLRLAGYSTTSTNLLWILVIESKNIGASEYVGIAQMLTYAYSSLAHQKRVWGLVTNGANYQFFYIQNDEELIYQRMPSLNLLDIDPATKLLEVLKAIRDWEGDR